MKKKNHPKSVGDLNTMSTYMWSCFVMDRLSHGSLLPQLTELFFIVPRNHKNIAFSSKFLVILFYLNKQTSSFIFF